MAVRRDMERNSVQMLTVSLQPKIKWLKVVYQPYGGARSFRQLVQMGVSTISANVKGASGRSDN